MKKILSFILGSIVALTLSMSVANSAAKEVRVAFFLEWPTPNQEDKVKGIYEKALGVPVKWTNFSNGGAMTCLLYTSPSPRDATLSRMPSSA